MNLRTIWLAVALGAAPLVAHAQISADVSFSWGSAPPPAEPVDSVDVFYDQLSPYGMWVDDPVVGQAFIPDENNYVPYTNGHWENTDVGFVWVSDEPFAWATSHYGRWWFSNDYGRWVWVPDTTWGPAWVDWYDAGGDLGWAPMAPQVVIDDGYQMPYDAYHYCPADRVLDTDVRRYYEPRDRVQVIQRQAQPIAYRTNIGSHQVIAGPAPRVLEAHHVRAQVRHIAPKQMGRLTATEVRTATQHAEQRKPQLEQQNARRLQAHAEIQKAVQQRATKAPARPNTTAPTRPETERTRTGLDRTPARPDVNRGEPNRAEPNRAEPNRAEPNRAPSRPDVNRTAPPRPDVNRAEPPRPDVKRTEPPRPEPMRAEPARPEPPRPEPMRAEPARPEPHAAPAAPHGESRGHDKSNEKRH